MSKKPLLSSADSANNNANSVDLESSEPEKSNHVLESAFKKEEENASLENNAQSEIDDLSLDLITNWKEGEGLLASGKKARQSISCLVQPESGDKVLYWTDQSGDEPVAWIITVIARKDPLAPVSININAPLKIEAPEIGFQSDTISIVADDFYSSSQTRNVIEQNRTETIDFRISHIGTDQRNAGSVEDRISGSFVQRIGTWFTNTLKEARHKARTFMFE